MLRPDIAARFFRLLFLGLILLCTPVFAQRTWQLVAGSPVTRNLNAVTRGDTLFVAVGDGGAIATSPEGLLWTARTSGTTRALYGVTYATSIKTFVAVGEAGTILSSTDGATWTARSSGTTLKLNAVAWAPKRFTQPDVFLAVGASGIVLRSYDLVTWVDRTPMVSNPALNAVISPGADTFVAVNSAGRVLTTRDAGETFKITDTGTSDLRALTLHSNSLYAAGLHLDALRSSDAGGTWQQYTINSDGKGDGLTCQALVSFNGVLIATRGTELIDRYGRAWPTATPFRSTWLGLAASRDRVIAVGTEGSIATALVDPLLALEYTLDTTVLAGDTVIVATPRYPQAPSLNHTLHWAYNGTSLDSTATGNRTILRLKDHGKGSEAYSLIARGVGVDASAEVPITITALLAPVPSVLVDSRFAPVLSQPPTHVVPLPDGRFYVATPTQVSRLTTEGLPDPAFSPRVPVDNSTVRALTLDTQGNLLVSERADNAAVGRTVRLRADGLVDPQFAADFPAFASSEAPIPAGDHLLTIERRPATSAGSPSTVTAVLRRYGADGTLDPGFAPVELMTAPSDGAALSQAFTGPRVIFSIDSQRRIYVALQHSDTGNTVSMNGGTSRLFRLLPDGTPDASFTPHDVGPLHTLVATSQGLLVRIVEERWARPAGASTTTTLARLRFDGTRDDAYASRTRRYDASTFLATSLNNNYDALTVSSGAFIARTVGQHGHFGLVRFDEKGALDCGFAAELGSDATAITQVHALPSGQLLVAGGFRALGGVPQAYLARLTPVRDAATTHFANLSARALNGPQFIVGYATRGGETSVLVRAAGPALAAFNVPNRASDPALELYFGNTRIAQNDDWGQGPADFLAATATRLNAFPFPAGSADAALYTTSASSPFTLQVVGKSAQGVALAEIYHAGVVPVDAASPRITNLSVRTLAGTGAETLIVGFTLKGTTPRNVVLRAVGPGLSRFGVTSVLADPTLTLYSGSTAIARNDNWAPDPATYALLTEAFATVGAFPLEATASAVTVETHGDAAMIVPLAPGSYTLHVDGKRPNGSGIALVELYEVP